MFIVDTEKTSERKEKKSRKTELCSKSANNKSDQQITLYILFVRRVYRKTKLSELHKNGEM